MNKLRKLERALEKHRKTERDVYKAVNNLLDVGCREHLILLDRREHVSYYCVGCPYRELCDTWEDYSGGKVNIDAVEIAVEKLKEASDE